MLKNKKNRVSLAVSTLILLCSCSSQAVDNIKSNKDKIEAAKGKIVWDFDHKLQYRQKSLANNKYRLEVLKTNKVDFNRMATFLIRQSYEVCGSYGYTLKMNSGIELFTDQMAMPNRVRKSLIAEVQC